MAVRWDFTLSTVTVPIVRFPSSWTCFWTSSRASQTFDLAFSSSDCPHAASVISTATAVRTRIPLIDLSLAPLEQPLQVAQVLLVRAAHRARHQRSRDRLEAGGLAAVAK